jgi:hypothetical protein
LYSRENFEYLRFTVDLPECECATTTGKLEYKLNVDVNWPIATSGDISCHFTALIAVASPLQLIFISTNDSLMIHNGTSGFGFVITRHRHSLTCYSALIGMCNIIHDVPLNSGYQDHPKELDKDKHTHVVHMYLTPQV